VKYTTWEAQIVSREVLPENALLDLFDPAKEIREMGLLEAINLIAKECEVPAGKLRPQDRFEEMLKRLPIHNPIRWFYMENKIAHHQENLEFAVWGRMKKLGLPKNSKKIITAKDYVMLWCGKQS
jgi:hypothetical protein